MPRTKRKVTKTGQLIIARVCRIKGGQVEAARYFGVNQSSISRYVNGTTPVPKSLIMLARAMVDKEMLT